MKTAEPISVSLSHTDRVSVLLLSSIRPAEELKQELPQYPNPPVAEYLAASSFQKSPAVFLTPEGDEVEWAVDLIVALDVGAYSGAVHSKTTSRRSSRPLCPIVLNNGTLDLWTVACAALDLRPLTVTIPEIRIDHKSD
jgi:hypothetical protein